MSAQTEVAPIIIKRKKSGGGDGHHGGAWKVAYADFVTAMMAFFMLMWLLNATTEKQRKGLADYFSPSVPIHRVSSGSDDPFGGDSVFSQDTLQKDGTGASAEHPSDSRKAKGETGLAQDLEAQREEEALKKIEEELMGIGGESMVTAEAFKHIVTKVTDEGLLIELFDTEEERLFEPGTAEPTRLMRELAAVIGRVSNETINGVAVAGHVHANPIVVAQNPVWALSAGRAERVRVLLEAGGLAPNRIKRVTGHADRTPATDNPVEIRNNRVIVTLLRAQKRK